MSTVPNRTGLLQKTWSLLQIHPGKMLCMQQTDLCMHRLTAGSKPQGKKRKMLFLPVTKNKLRKLVLLRIKTYMSVYFPGRAELQPVLFEGFVA